VLANAYENDVAVDWMYLSQETWMPTFERPATHFQNALSLLDEGKNSAAADEIRRGAGYFKLAARSARADDRALLMQKVAELATLAKRASAGTLKADVLRKALVDTDNAYAESYLHQAEESWAKKESRQPQSTRRQPSYSLRLTEIYPLAAQHFAGRDDPATRHGV